MEKLLSIIVPTYNAEQFLDKGLTSFILDDEEKMAKLEVLVIIDGATDGSKDKAQEYVDRYPDVFRIVEKENGGHGSGINRGALEASGRFFKVVDADDWVEQDGLKAYMDFLETTDADAVITDYKTYDISNGEVELHHAEFPDGRKEGNMKDVMENWLSVEWGFLFHGISYRTEFYRAQKYKVEEKIFYEDQEFNICPMIWAEKVAVTGICVYIYRIGDVNQSVAGQNQVKRLSHQERVIAKVLRQEQNIDRMSEGAYEYWKKKTSMLVTSYYQIALLKNNNKKDGRRLVASLNRKLRKKNTVIWPMVQKKCKMFVAMSYLHISNEMYMTIAPALIRTKRRIKRERI